MDTFDSKRDVIQSLILLLQEGNHPAPFKTISSALYTSFFEYDELVTQIVNKKKDEETDQ